MKTTLTIALLATSAGLICAEAAIPMAFSKDRYAETEETSPFVLETKVDNTPPPAPKDSPFKNMILTGIGTDYVTIKHMGDDMALRFYGNRPNDDHIFVKEVHASEKPSECYVVLRKGEEEGQVKYDENFGRNASAANPAQPPRPPGTGNPAIPQPRPASIVPPIVQGSVPKAPSSATMNVPRPTMSGRDSGRSNGSSSQVPRPSGAINAPPNGLPPGSSGNTGAPRIRVRSVNNR